MDVHEASDRDPADREQDAASGGTARARHVALFRRLPHRGEHVARPCTLEYPFVWGEKGY